MENEIKVLDIKRLMFERIKEQVGSKETIEELEKDPRWNEDFMPLVNMVKTLCHEVVDLCAENLFTGYNHLDHGIGDKGDQRYISEAKDILRTKKQII